ILSRQDALQAADGTHKIKILDSQLARKLAHSIGDFEPSNDLDERLKCVGIEGIEDRPDDAITLGYQKAISRIERKLLGSETIDGRITVQPVIFAIGGLEVRSEIERGKRAE